MSRPSDETRLQAYLDGELTAAEQAEFAAELERSPELRARLAQLQAAGRLAQQSALPEMPAGLEERIMARTQAPRTANPRLALGFLAGGTVSSLLLVLLILPYFGKAREKARMSSGRDVYVTFGDTMTTRSEPHSGGTSFGSRRTESRPSADRYRDVPPPGATDAVYPEAEESTRRFETAADVPALKAPPLESEPLPRSAPTVMNSYDVPVQVRREPAEPLQAGEIDDNEMYGKYLTYLRDEPRHEAGLARMHQQARLIIQTLGPDGERTEPNIPVTVWPAGSQSRQDRPAFRGTTDAGGQTIYFPFATNQDLPATFRVEAPNHVAETVRLESQQTQVVRLRSTVRERVTSGLTLKIAFVVDTTGSMGEEIDRIRDGIDWIVAGLEKLPQQPHLELGLVLYRDQGDDYATKAFDFTPDIARFRGWLNQVRANGGGDTPEAVEESLATMLDKLAWDQATVRLAFLIGDAPPHLGRGNVRPYHQSALQAVEKGIKIEAISTSGNDDVGEYVWRQLALLTGGKFLFITKGPDAVPDSTGAGGPGSTPHHVARQDYSVQNLPELILDLITRELASVRQPPRDYPQTAALPTPEPAEVAPPLPVRPEPVRPYRPPFDPRPWLAVGIILLNIIGWGYAYHRSTRPLRRP